MEFEVHTASTRPAAQQARWKECRTPDRIDSRPSTARSTTPFERQRICEVPEHELDLAASTFMANRPQMFGIAYRMLGSIADAEDIVQDVWLRWQNCDRNDVREPSAFLAVTTTRLAINTLHSAHTRHDAPIGDRLQEAPSGLPDPGIEAERAEALMQAVRLLLVKLYPTERAAFILREGFGYPYERIAALVHTSEVTARQHVSRARKRLTSGHTATLHPLEHRRLFNAIVAAAEGGDIGALERLLVLQGTDAAVRIVA